jgi:hypothetical protein
MSIAQILKTLRSYHVLERFNVLLWFIEFLSGNPWLSSRGGKKDRPQTVLHKIVLSGRFFAFYSPYAILSSTNRLERRQTSRRSQTVSLRHARQTVHLARIGMRANALSTSSTCRLLSVWGARLKTLGRWLISFVTRPTV